MTYIAVIHIPDSDEPLDASPPLDTAQEAWASLAEARKAAEEAVPSEAYDDGDADQFELSEVYQNLDYIASGEHQHGNPNEDWPTDEDGTGVVFGHAPGRRTDTSDPGLAYRVVIA